MGKTRGFMEIERVNPGHRPVNERLLDFKEFEKRLSDEEIRN